MRKYSIIRDKTLCKGELLKKVMICEVGKSVLVFLYTTEEDFFSCDSKTFDSVSEAELYCRRLGITSFDWIVADDCLEYCNLDWIAPVRRKGRVDGTFYSGDIYEKLVGSDWIEFEPFKE